MDEQSTHQAQPEPQVDTSDSKRPGFAACSFWSVGIILLLYILSIGPAVSLARKSRIPFKAIPAVYFPIFRFCDAYRPALKCLNWYLNKVSHTAVFFDPSNHHANFMWATVGPVFPPSGSPHPNGTLAK